MTWIPVKSLDDPRILDYRDQKDAWLRVQASAEQGEPSTGLPNGLFMAEGVLVIDHLLRSRHQVRSILGTPMRLQALENQVGSIDEHITVFSAEQAVMDQIAGFSIHRGLLACAQAAPMPSLESLLPSTRTLVVLEDLSNHDNVGGIFRNVAALGGESAGVLLSPRCCDPLYRKAIRVSMGHVLHVPFTRSVDWVGDLERIAQAGFKTIALTPDRSAAALSPVSGLVALLLGAEGPGLTETALSQASVVARIPMAEGVDSLNVSVSAAIALDRLNR